MSLAPVKVPRELLAVQQTVLEVCIFTLKWLHTIHLNAIDDCVRTTDVTGDGVAQQQLRERASIDIARFE
jgi:hypothetical protein